MGTTLEKKSLIQKLKNDFPALEIGTKGKWLNQDLEIIGRTQILANDLYLNVWQVQLSGEKLYFLYENNRRYALLEEEDKINLPSQTGVDNLGDFVVGQTGVLSAVYTVESVVHAGETKDIFSGQSRAEILVLEDVGGGCTLAIPMKSKTGFLGGHYVRLSDLGIGLSAESFQVKESEETISCPKCQAKIRRLMGDLCRYKTCQNCRYLIDLRDLSVLGKAGAIRESCSLSPGDHGVFKGVSYVVSGKKKVRESGKPYSWMEYSLFNPDMGFVTLSEFEGNWIFFTPSNLIKKDGVKYSISVHNRVYRNFLNYRAETVHCRGEFPEKPLHEEAVMCREFISPPHMIVSMRTDHEFFWLKGESVEPEEVKEAFSVERMDTRKGIGSLQPNPLAKSMKRNFIAYAVMFFVILIATIVMNSAASDEKIFSIAGTFSKGHEEVIRSNNFILPSQRQNLEFSFFSNGLENRWLDFDVFLIESRSGKEFHFVQSMAHYSGVDGGEVWEEGDKSESTLLSSIPSGDYYVMIIPEGEFDVDFSVTLRRDVPINSNATVILLLGLVFPAIQLYRYTKFENLRWENSDKNNV